MEDPCGTLLASRNKDVILRHTELLKTSGDADGAGAADVIADGADSRERSILHRDKFRIELYDMEMQSVLIKRDIIGVTYKGKEGGSDYVCCLGWGDTCALNFALYPVTPALLAKNCVLALFAKLGKLSLDQMFARAGCPEPSMIPSNFYSFLMFHIGLDLSSIARQKVHTKS